MSKPNKKQPLRDRYADEEEEIPPSYFRRERKCHPCFGRGWVIPDGKTIEKCLDCDGIGVVAC